MPTKPAALFSVSWGCDVSVELAVTSRIWAKIVRGETMTIRGRGYRYEGDFFWDYWDFEGGLDGSLIVRYGSPRDHDYSGQGAITTPREALVQSGA